MSSGLPEGTERESFGPASLESRIQSSEAEIRFDRGRFAPVFFFGSGVNISTSVGSRKFLLGAALSLGVAVVIGSVSAQTKEGKADDSITLSGFYFECSRAFGMKVPEGWEESKSWMLVRATGLKVDGTVDLSQPLRQKHVIQIASQLGIQLSSATPEKLFSQKQVEAFLTRFHEYFRLPLKLPVKKGSPAAQSQGTSENGTPSGEAGKE